MATITATPNVTQLRLPTVAEVREMLSDRFVWVTAILASLIAVLGLMAGIVILAVTGHATDALTNTFSLGTLVGVIMALNKIRNVEKAVKDSNATTPTQ